MDQERLEGSGISRLVQVIRGIGYNKFDRIELATVTSEIPFALRVDGNMKFELDASDVIVAECLTDRTEVIRHADGTLETITRMGALKVGDRVIVSSMNNGQICAILDRMVLL